MCWVVVLEQAGGLHGIRRWFKFILGVFYLFLIFLGIVNGYCWSICDGYYLIVFNTCKHYILFCWKLVLWWVIMLEQTGGLNGDIRWFNIILGVFLIFLELWIDIVELLLYDYINFFFSILVNILYCDVDDWYCGGLLCWSKRVGCMVI